MTVFSTTSVYDEKEFEERSDYINDTDLELWNVENEHFNHIQQKLLGVGAKLLVGPRGTGKTHQMKIAHLKCQKDKSKPLSLFVSFSKYYHLEPFLTKAPNAIQIFHTWVLCKILLSAISIIEDEKESVPSWAKDSNLLTKETIQEFVAKAEKLKASQLSDDLLISALNINWLVTLLEQLTIVTGRKRLILMLDDAALTLTPEYLVEFFEIFRSLKTKIINPKASVYPGTTQFGPRFHVNHDAEMVKCWLSVESPTYSSFMDSLIKKRFENFKEGVSTELIELFKFSSFGVPRAFISLLRNYRSRPEKVANAKFNAVIEQQAQFIETEYLSISQKLIQYKKVIESGNRLFKQITQEIKDDNSRLVDERNLMIGISSESIEQYKLADRMIRFLIEAGLLYEDIPVKHGQQEGSNERREYRRYIPHMIFLIQNRTFVKSNKGGFKEVLNSINLKARKQPLRRSIRNLLTTKELDGLTLDLPPCQNCSTPRLTPEQRFCHICGNELVNQSAFETCLKISVNELPLTNWTKDRLVAVKLNTVGDIISLQDPGSELRKIPQIGQIRSNKIYNEVLKTVDEFLA
ncbi:hypothetical protein SAMN05660226_02280 [Parapedobacter luteus]|uniref:Zinc ribbon domain-containing protein n=1 Tax=Parapedobacter luteus TaxID=623280 RepID=A0A1T5CK14_9SPHI|nr:hypothetical protein [Parapedobacter luteus]SKB59744.1 hypothetical protein SAMN05660226_02280 [Parapedobacter luteus]